MARKLSSDQLDRVARELFQSRNPVYPARRPDADFLVGFRSKLSAELEIPGWSPAMIGDFCWRFAPLFATMTLLLAGLLILKPLETSSVTAAEQIFWSTVASSEDPDLTRDQVTGAIIVFDGREDEP
jgi:hypothetical protein